MRIGIDATAMSDQEGTGMESYARNLTLNLLEHDASNEYVIYCRRPVPAALREFEDRAELRTCGLRKRKLCEQIWLSAAWRTDDLDVLHCICSLPIAPPERTVLTVHGLSWRLTPEVFTRTLRWYWILTAERTMHKATRLIAITNWTKNVVHSHLDIPKDRIDVVHHGVELDEFATSPGKGVEERVRRKYGLSGRILLHVGTLIPVKNLPFLVRAFSRLVSSGSYSDCQLVLAGGKGWGAEDVSRAITDTGMEDRVIVTGHIPKEELIALYHLADLFVFPTKYEGFGLPMLESFAAGTPVVASKASCLPEVGGDAAIYFDTDSMEQLCARMRDCLCDEDLRQKMINRGKQRVEEFSWEKTARQTLQVYQRAVESVSS